ncbi:MAG: FHIPEP family type III secretion protein [Deltaproteobacteria bacterium]|nr:FHIPEP family type III secretion protein [Deltaproteobacteria bacterium]
MHSHVRTTLSRAILDDSCATRGVLRAFVLSPELEEGFRDAVSVWDGPPRPLPLEPNIEEQFRRNVQRMFRPVVERGALPVVILCSGEVRAAVHEALRTYDFQGEWYTTVAFEELGNHARTETVGVISL